MRRSVAWLVVRRYLFLAFIGLPVVVVFRPLDLYGAVPIKRFLVLAAPIACAYSGAVLGYHRFASLLLRSRRRPMVGPGRNSRHTFVRLAAFLAVAVFLMVLVRAGANEYLVTIVSGMVAYVSILYSLDRLLFLGLFGLDVVAVCSLVRWFRRPKRRIWQAGLFVWLYFWCALVFFSAFKAGPTAAHCKGLGPHSVGVRVLLSREGLGSLAGQEEGLPYDVVAGADGRYLVASLKRTDFRPGALVKIDLEKGAVVGVLPVGDPSSGLMEFPEQLACDSDGHEVFALVYSPGRYRLLVVDGLGEEFRVARTIPLPGEPNGVFFNKKERTVFVSLTGKAPWSGVVIDAKGSDIHISKTLPRGGHSDANYDLIFDANFDVGFRSNLTGDKLLQIDPCGYNVVRSKYLLWPLVGLAMDETGGRIYAASPLTYSVFEIDRATLGLIGSIPVTGGLSHLALDPHLRELYVGYYGGRVEAVDLDSKKRLWTVEVGRMLRKIRYHEKMKSLFVSSGCGIFEIITSDVALGK
jgi:DNA-binding beta-propeller fold protein YncE